MGVPCPDCAVRNPHGATTCGGCGRSLDSAQASLAERRHLTVFFADIAGSTTLAESLDPEELRELYAQYQNVCAEVVQRYEGHLAQYLGDGILVYFGYPKAHEDDAARAIRSGLEILQRLERIVVGGTRAHVRIGIHTGLVVVGDVGTGIRREQLALGEAPNIAARLQSEAAPDTIVISDATKRLVAGVFSLEDLGSRTLKGISRPMQLFRVLGKSGATSRFRAMTAATGLTPFVGREREVGLIRAAWAEAVARRGQTVLLRGEAGIGKSRLLVAAKLAAGNLLHEVLEAECSPYQMHSALSPMIELLGRRMGLEPEMSAGDKLDLIEQFAAGRGVKLEDAALAIAGLLSVPTGDRYPLIDMPSAKQRQWTIEILAELLLRSVGGSPILLLIEDLHWADPSTLDLVNEIVARQADLPVLVVCTTRPERSAPWPEKPHCQEIRVESLPPEDTRALVASVVGRKSLPLALMEELVARTSGIPLFVEAVTHTVIEAGILRELEDRFELTGPLPPGLIPNTVQASLMGRIDRLGTDRAVAQLAATIGREFSFELLQSVLGQPTEELSRALQHLVDLDLVSQSGAPPAATYTFKHALIQDAAYESLLRKTRQDFHGKIAEALIGRFPEMAETKPELLARHYEGAGRIDEATASWMKAGMQAQQRSALRESVAYLRKVISLLENLPEQDPRRLRSEMEAQLALSPALMSTLGWGSREVETACIRARDLCERLGNSQGLLAAQWGLWTVYLLRGTIGPCLEAAKPVLEMALASGDPALHIIARQAVGYSCYFLGDFAAAREHAEKALALYNLDQERALVSVFQLPASFACGNFLMMSLWFMGYPDQAEQRRRQAWAFIEALAIPACTAYGLGNALMIDYARRDRVALAPRAEQLYMLATEGGQLLWAAQGRIYRGWVQAMEGDPEAGIAEMNAGLESYRLTGSGLMMPQMCLMLAEAQWRAGRPGEALAALSRGLKLAGEKLEHVHEPELHRLKGEIQIALGANAAGEASLRLALELAQAQQAKMLELRAAIALAKLQRDTGRSAEARALLEPLRDWFLEGHDTPELIETRAILDAMQSE
jgi:class 3 adenylate cyclase/predicted ATPase/ABC-type transport system involved in cytochrome c biogenesis ATPase subunit